MNKFKVVLGCALICAAGSTSRQLRAEPASQNTTSLSGSPVGASRRIREMEYEVTQQTRSVLPNHPGGLHMANRAQDLRAYFLEGGMDLVRRTEKSPTWSVHMAMESIDDDTGSMPAAIVQPGFSGRAVTFERAEAVESYENLEDGVRLRIVLPQASADLPAGISYRLRTSLKAQASADGSEVGLYRKGRRLVKLSVAQATDADGQPLQATLSARKGHLLISYAPASPGSANAATGVIVVLNLTGPGGANLQEGVSTTPDWTYESNQTSANLGVSSHTAGDVNGDGFSDVIIGAELYDNGTTDTGRAWLFLGSASGLAATPAWIGEETQAESGYGFAVNTAGDVNGDGYDDVLVGSGNYDNGNHDEGRVYLYLGSASGLSATPSWYAEANSDTAFMGYSVSTAGDVNGDGYADIIVGALRYWNVEFHEGRAYMWLGGPNGPGQTPSWITESNQANAEYGVSVSTAGDVNGDGYDDVIVGALQYGNGQTNEGRVYVYHGSASGLSTTPAWIAESNQAQAFLGFWVSTAGDVNGDGYSDVVSGADQFDNGQNNEGRAFCWLGGPSGLAASPSWTAESNQAGALMGKPIETAGDVNGDGFSDVIVSARSFDNGQTDEGRVLLYLGSPFGLETTPAWTAEGNQASGTFGAQASTAGDVNGDGYSDILISARLFDNGQTDEGRAFLYLSTPTGPAATPSWSTVGLVAGGHMGASVAPAGDVNGDGYSDVIVGSPDYDAGLGSAGRAFVFAGSDAGLISSPLWEEGIDQPLASFGASVAGAGDINGDGYADVLVGAPGFANGESGEGAAFLYLGSTTGPDAGASWRGEGDQAGAQFGASLGTAGDVNGDGVSDFIVGAPGYSNGQSAEGAAFVFLGDTTSGPILAWRAEADQAGAQLGASVAGAGDINRDGFSDVIAGAPFYDNGQSDEGAAFLYAGSGGGPGNAPLAMLEADQAGAHLGAVVATANDVNGDGYSDVIVGAPLMDNGQIDEGMALVFQGSGSGLAGPIWSAESDQAGAQLGSSVNGAGNLNGDGFGDLIVGSSLFDNGQTDEGMARLYMGSATGPKTTPLWSTESNQAGAALGTSVAGGGDINGDGLADLILGAPGFDASGDEGKVQTWLGGGRDGLARRPRQARADGTAPLSLLDQSDSETQFRVRLRGRTPIGRDRIRLQIEVKPLAVPFDGTGLTQTAWLDTGAPGMEGSSIFLDETVSGLNPQTPYKWRARCVTSSPLFPRSAWYTLPDNGRTETDLRTGGCTDQDGDGYGFPGSASCLHGGAADCDDSSASQYPGATELCDNLDNDCDGDADEFATSCGSGACTSAGFCTAGSDTCTPGTPAASDATCDGLDDDCDGAADEDFAAGPTTCGVGACAATGTNACVNGVEQDTCTPGTPAASDATCDGIDDDCDGTADEEYPSGPISCGVGACQAAGTTTCVAGLEQTSCTPGMPGASDAICNAIDDDCDGAADEDFQSTPTSCGVGACGSTGATSCVAGVEQNSCTPGVPAASDPTCNAIDDDCDGAADEDYQSTPTTCGVGACGSAGTTSCVAGVEQNSCTPGVPAASDPTCNAIDDDCDGAADEDYQSTPTTCGVGACGSAGTTSCVAGVEQNSCTPGVPAASDPTCNAIDDDCDGAADEDYQSTPTTCGVGACGSAGTTSCVAGVEQNSCTPGTPAATDATCNGIDDDCSGAADEDYQSTPTSCGVGACGSTGATSCVAGVEQNSCTPGTPAATDATCNGIDDDCSGAADEDYQSTPTSCGVGGCGSTGATSCVAGVEQNSCTPGTPAATDTTCNGIDDDCDGAADEDYQSTPTSCGVGGCGSTGATSCVAGVEQNSCTPGTPAATDATCNGIDDDCSGAADEDYQSTPTSCGVGACGSTGATSCVAGVEQNSCTPGTPAAADATCNAIDDDCDGAADEDFQSTPTSCGVGACGSTGATTCVAGVEQNSCTPGVPAASDSTCNAIDDDCDGAADEDYQSTPTSCGVGACGSTGATSCVAGVEQNSCTPGTPAASDATCNGIDDDCDGAADEDFQSTPTSCGVGACGSTGVTSCVAGVEQNSCTPGTPGASDATCNGIDDDCSGTADEDYQSTPTSCGVGACQAAGASACVAGVEQSSCTPGTPAASDATCNAIDDDCDGAADEDYQSTPTSCGVGACQSAGTSACVAGVEQSSCTPGTPAASDATCNGIDDDCDGAADEDYQFTPTTCGVGACQAAGTSACVAGVEQSSCTPGTPAASDPTCNAIDDDCDGAADEDYQSTPTSCGVGACGSTGASSCVAGVEQSSCTPGTPAASDATCNGIDDDCDGAADEDYQAAMITCGVGACQAAGITACVAGVEQSSCVPGTPAASDATCNGIDDDCDGAADEDYQSTPTSCGVGACGSTGATSCVAGVEQSSCTPGVPAASDETCNAIDDDCDGAADEDFQATPTSCGVGACGSTGATSCVAGVEQNSCTPGVPAASDATCNAIDDDCDGAADEDYQSTPTSCGVGACQAAGTTSCAAGVEQSSCTPGMPAASDASCNAIDDDCDGATDEDYQATAITCGIGACQASGTTACVAGVEQSSCTPGTPGSADAICNGIDDDCDGTADEDFQSTSTSCGVGACGSTGATSCVAGVEQSSCTPGVPAASDATCNGIDDDCDGTADEDFQSTPTSCGVGACGSTGASSCVAGVEQNSCTPGVPAASDATCNAIDDDCDGTADEDFQSTQVSCGVGACQAAGTTACVAGVEQSSCTPGTPGSSDAICNGIDDDCDGATDEDFQPAPTTCGVGACQSAGATSCVAGMEQNSCAPGVPAASDATCNAIDDDCDGTADEDYQSTPTSCGIGACQAAGATTCVAGVEQSSCTPGAPAASDATCNAIDDDCDGAADEDYQATTISCGVGACQASGTTACVAGVEQSSCTPGTPGATDAICNGIDDDCDGSTDEDFQSTPTACGVGACQSAGATSCVAGVEQNSCTPGTPAASDATCNALDDDCDGTTDEDYQSTPTSCGVGACGSTGATSCVAGVEQDSCTPGVPAASDATCNAIDDDCDGTADEDYQSVPTTCGAGICQAAGTTACVAGVEETTCTPGVSAPETCNGLDDDCDGIVPAEELDSDGDGIRTCASDCDDSNGQVWATPGEVPSVDVASDTQTLSWTQPASMGGASVNYDLIRSDAAGDFVSAATCVVSDTGPSTTALDASIPAAEHIFYYLARARNACPAGLGTLGFASGGSERQGRTCP